MERFILVILGIGAVSMGITFLLGKVAGRIKLLKYAPGVIFLVASVYYYYLSQFVRAGIGFEDLGNFILSIFFFAGAFFGIGGALILEYRERRKR